MRWVRGTVCPLLLGLASGCAFGPKMLERDHNAYAAAVQQVDEEQLLNTIVRLRYVESPQALDVTSIATQYELGATAEARPFFSTEASGNLFRSFSMILPAAGIDAANRPTISLIPSDDASSIRQFLTPISLDTLVFLTESGWPVSSILRIWVDRMNGVPNWVTPSGPPRGTIPDFQRFHRACQLLQLAQDEELLSVHAEPRTTSVGGPFAIEGVTGNDAVQAAKNDLKIEVSADGKSWRLIKSQPQLVLFVNPTGWNSPIIQELTAILHLEPGRPEYLLVPGAGISDPAKNLSDPSAELRLALRSSAQALFFLANGVEVPPEHLACGLVRLPAQEDPLRATEGLFRVHSCRGKRKHRPPAAYAAVWYRDHWYYIDDRDLESKATLLLMLQLRRLDFRRQKIGSVPALTLPLGR